MAGSTRKILTSRRVNKLAFIVYVGIVAAAIVGNVLLPHKAVTPKQKVTELQQVDARKQEDAAPAEAATVQPAAEDTQSKPSSTIPGPKQWGDPKVVDCNQKRNDIYVSYNQALAAENQKHNAILQQIDPGYGYTGPGSGTPQIPSPEVAGENARFQQATLDLYNQMQSQMNALNC